MNAKVQVDQYFTALERLKQRCAPISNDSVALEAGKGRGSIKKSRPAHAPLIEAIEAAAREQASVVTASDPVPALQRAIEATTRRLDESLEREVALLNQVYDLQAQCKQLLEENRALKLGRLVAVR